MSLAYRFLGFTSALFARLGRMRVNFLPLNWVAAVGLLAMLLAGLRRADAATHGASAQQDPVTMVALIVVPVALLAVFGWTTFSGHAVFQVDRATSSEPPRDADPATARTMDLRASGKFELAPHRRAFVEVPAMIARDENGRRMIAANVDASTRLFGFTTSARIGIWTIDLSGATPCEMGFAYWWLARRPALRCRATNGDVVILSFANDAQRALAGTALARA